MIIEFNNMLLFSLYLFFSNVFTLMFVAVVPGSLIGKNTIFSSKTKGFD